MKRRSKARQVETSAQLSEEEEDDKKEEDEEWTPGPSGNPTLLPLPVFPLIELVQFTMQFTI